MGERWRNVPGFDGYQASNLGRIRSINREWQQLSKSGTLYTHHKKGRVLKPAPSLSGHLTVVPGRRRGSTSVHKMVALAFYGPCPPGLETIHKDESKDNNRPSNLKYGTRSENLKRCYAAGNRIVHPNFIGARWRKRA